MRTVHANCAAECEFGSTIRRQKGFAVSLQAPEKTRPRDRTNDRAGFLPGPYLARNGSTKLRHPIRRLFFLSV